MPGNSIVRLRISNERLLRHLEEERQKEGYLLFEIEKTKQRISTAVDQMNVFSNKEVDVLARHRDVEEEFHDFNFKLTKQKEKNAALRNELESSQKECDALVAKIRFAKRHMLKLANELASLDEENSRLLNKPVMAESPLDVHMQASIMNELEILRGACTRQEVFIENIKENLQILLPLLLNQESIEIS